LAATVIIMEGGDADNYDIADFVLTGAGDLSGVTADAISIAVAGMLVTYRYYIGGGFTQGVA